MRCLAAYLRKRVTCFLRSSDDDQIRAAPGQRATHRGRHAAPAGARLEIVERLPLPENVAEKAAIERAAQSMAVSGAKVCGSARMRTSEPADRPGLSWQQSHC
jgi:hypothetical protein